MTINLRINNLISIPKTVPKFLIKEIKKQYTCINPEYTNKSRRGYSTRGVPKHIYCYEESKNMMNIYRGDIEQLIKFIKSSAGYAVKTLNMRIALPDREIEFLGKLYEYQTKTIEKYLQHDFGIISAPCGSGKTVMGLKIISERK